MFARSLLRAVAVTAAALAAGCVDAPTGVRAPEIAATSDPLALTFDELAKQAQSSGDVARAEGFTFAAIAARSGITPSTLNVRNGAVNESWEAFVSSIQWNLPSTAPRLPAHRTVTAWRRTADGMTRILSFTTPSDSAPILNPLSLSPSGPPSAPFAGASALYQETTRFVTPGVISASTQADVFWIATGGFVKIREGASSIGCPVEPDKAGLKGVTCQQARFSVRFGFDMQRLATRPYGIAPGSVARRFSWPDDQTVAGYKLVFSCAAPTASKGCG